MCSQCRQDQAPSAVSVPEAAVEALVRLDVPETLARVILDEALPHIYADVYTDIRQKVAAAMVELGPITEGTEPAIVGAMNAYGTLFLRLGDAIDLNRLAVAPTGGAV